MAWAIVFAVVLAARESIAQPPGVLGDELSLVQQQPLILTPTPPEAGDVAEVMVEEGLQKGTWVPCKILKARGKSLVNFDIHVASGPVTTHYGADILKVESRLVRPINQTEYELALASLAQDQAAGKKLVVQLEKESLHRTREVLRLKGVKPDQIRKKIEEMQNEKKKLVDLHLKKTGCPSGYLLGHGDIKGADQFGRGISNRLETMDACAEDCSKRPECLSFEYNANNKMCNLNKLAEPDFTAMNKDFMFCQRVKFDAADAASSEPSSTPIPL